MFVCPIDIPPVPIQIHENWGTPLPPTGEFCGWNVDGIPMKCVCTAEEHERYAPQYGDAIIPVFPYEPPSPQAEKYRPSIYHDPNNLADK